MLKLVRSGLWDHHLATVWPNYWTMKQKFEVWIQPKVFFFWRLGTNSLKLKRFGTLKNLDCRPRYSHTHFTKNLFPTILYQFCDDVVRHELCFSKSVHVVPTYSKCTHQDQAKAQDCALKMSELLWQLTVCFTVRWSAGLWSYDCC